MGGAGRSHITGGLIVQGYLQDPGRKQQETKGGALELNEGIICKGMSVLKVKGGNCSRETYRLSEQELWPSVGTRDPAHQSAFCQELTWLRLVFKDHSDLSGTGCGQEVQ